MSAVPKSLTDLEILNGIRRKDPGTVNYCYQEFLPRIRKFMASNSGSDNDAMDFFQEAMVVVFRKSQDEQFNLGSAFFTYVYAIVRNLWFKELKKRKRRGVTIDLEKVSMGTEDFTNTITEHDKFRLFQSKLNSLSDSCQEILRLFFEGKSMREISEILNISEKYARKRKFNCKENLIKLVKADPLFKELSTHG